MKKFIIKSLLGLVLLALASCSPGEATTFSASKLGTSPLEKEQTVTISDHLFTYYNVSSDSNGNFILADSSSYITNSDMIFGIRFLHSTDVCVYDLSDASNISKIEAKTKDYDNGDWGYQIDNYGFKISLDSTSSTSYTKINIGQITHWC